MDFFFYTEKLSILSGNINGYILLSHYFLETLLAFIFLVEEGNGVKEMIFSVYKF